MKLSKQQAALSHARAYIFEQCQDVGLDPNSHELADIARDLDKLKTIKSVVQYLNTLPFNIECVPFYQAMLKVVPHIAYPEHSGTECRGWYRVWGSMVNETDYWSRFDMYRDIEMARDFYTHGAVTKAQWNRWMTRHTLKLAAHMVDDTGVVNVAMIKKAFKPDWLARCVDVRVLAALELAGEGSMATFSSLKY